MVSIDPQQEARDRALFDRISQAYARKDVTPSSRLARQYTLQYALGPALEKVGDHGHLVEFACGAAAPARHLRGRYRAYTGIDYSENLIEAARQFHHDNPAARFIASNIKDVDLGADRADLVFAVGALHHMTEWDKVFSALHRLARPGAYFVAVEPLAENPVVQTLRWVRAKVDSSYSADQHYFSLTELRDLCESNGLVDVETACQGFFSPPFAEVILPVQPITRSLSQASVWIDRLLDRTLPDRMKRVSWNVVVRGRFPG